MKQNHDDAECPATGRAAGIQTGKFLLEQRLFSGISKLRGHVTFRWANIKFEALLDELKKAKRFIFLEYFIIAEGIMWNSVLGYSEGQGQGRAGCPSDLR